MLLLAVIASLVQGRCWDADLQQTSCREWQYVAAGYDCVTVGLGTFCYAIDPASDEFNADCAVLRPEGWIVDPQRGICFKQQQHVEGCSYGEFVSSYNNNKCESCPKGQYQNAAFHTSTSCKDQYDTICKEGEKYIAENDGSRRPSPCEQCSAGQYQDSGYHRSTRCKPQTNCGPGEMYIDRTGSSKQQPCKDCTPGVDYQDAANHQTRQCKQQTQGCSGGQTIVDGNSITKRATCKAAPTTTPPQAQQYCTYGEYLSDTGCQTCPLGQYQDSGYHQSTSCMPQTNCGPGEYYIGGSSQQRPCVQCTRSVEYQSASNHRFDACTPQTKDCDQGETLKGGDSITERATCEAAPTPPPTPSPPTSTASASTKPNNTPAQIETTTPPTKSTPGTGGGSSTDGSGTNDSNGGASPGSNNGEGGSMNGSINNDQTSNGASNSGGSNGDTNNNNSSNAIADDTPSNNNDLPNNNNSSAVNGTPAVDVIEPPKSNAGVTVIVILLVLVATFVALVLLYCKTSKDTPHVIAQQPYSSDFPEDYAEIDDTRDDSSTIARGAGAVAVAVAVAGVSAGARAGASDQTIQRCQYRQPGPGGQRCRTRTATAWCDKHACRTPGCPSSKSSRVQVCEACSTHQPGVQGGVVAGTVYDVGGGNAGATGDVVMVAVDVGDDTAGVADGGRQPRQRAGLNQQGSVYLGFDDTNEESML